MGIDQAVLRRSIRGDLLSPAELESYRQHSVLGMAIVEGLDRMKPVRMLIRAHHERFDGQGYPDGLAGEAIPLEARILALVEDYCTFRAMATPPETFEDPVGYFHEASGQAYDPSVVEAFFEVLVEYSSSGSLRDIDTDTTEVLLDEVEPGLLLAADVRTPRGVLIVPRGEELTAELIRKLKQQHITGDRVVVRTAA
jgi:HD-GYP domain-containing protein (c-di-GMP phosphodiesterase class II)